MYEDAKGAMCWLLKLHGPARGPACAALVEECVSIDLLGVAAALLLEAKRHGVRAPWVAHQALLLGHARLQGDDPRCSVLLRQVEEEFGLTTGRKVLGEIAQIWAEERRHAVHQAPRHVSSVVREDYVAAAEDKRGAASEAERGKVEMPKRLAVAQRLGRRAKRKDDVSRKRACLLYTSPSPRDQRGSRMPSSA